MNAVSGEISQRELRNDSGRIMRELTQGETFIITRNGEPIGELTPLRRRRFVRARVQIGSAGGQLCFEALHFRLDRLALVLQFGGFCGQVGDLRLRSRDHLLE